MKSDLILSTRLVENRATDYRAALLDAADLGFSDLEARVSALGGSEASIVSLLGERRLRVRCARRPDPLPTADAPAARTSAPTLSATSDSARADALNDATRLGETAMRIGCDTIVLSLGALEWEGAALRESDVVQRFSKRPSLDEAIRAEISTLRRAAEERATSAADRACRSLHELVKKLPDVRIALAGARLPADLADPLRLQWILDDLPGKALCYWHDVGAAEAQRALGLVEPGEWLDRFSSRLAGISLHDAQAFSSHRVPGHGTVDFRLLRGYVSSRTLRVLDLAPGTTAADVAEARRFLEKESLA
ncbi:MAG: hypothetical protein HYR85_10875 [Planctomycetes bacterium]|nr:hypothetical protein [Planctomycetota bacterium]MBI3847282.1 hypothetical protein [Planctomycetota bacterium]